MVCLSLAFAYMLFECLISKFVNDNINFISIDKIYSILYLNFNNIAKLHCTVFFYLVVTDEVKSMWIFLKKGSFMRPENVELPMQR